MASTPPDLLFLELAQSMKEGLVKQIPVQIITNFILVESELMLFFFLHYCVPFQLFQIKCTVENLEAVQKTTTKMIKGWTNIPSEERLKEQSLFSLEKGRLNKELIIVLKYMKKCVSDKKQIPLLLMSPEQDKSDERQREELYVILRKPPWLSKTPGTSGDCSNGWFMKNLNIYLLLWVHVKSLLDADG